MSKRVPVIIAVAVVAIVGIGAWLWLTAGQESTDDAQVEAHVTPIAARVGGTVLAVPAPDNREVDAGQILLQIDPRDFEVALARAEAELANVEAEAAAARAGVPIMSTTTTSNVSTARGGVAQAEASVAEAEQSLEAARARVVTAQARLREQEANATRAARDVERLRPLIAKQEIAQQQFDTAVADAEAKRAAADSAGAQIQEAEAAIRVAESHIKQAHAGQEQATAGLRQAETAPEQVAQTRARLSSAEARVKQAETAVKQAQLNLDYATVRSPIKGIVSKKSVEPGQVVQPGQPLMTVIPLDRIWISANFKETQLAAVRPGQRVTVKVDAYGGREFNGKVDSIAAATGSRFSLLPADNSSGNFVKVVQRVPVKILLDDSQDKENVLRPGMSVTPTIYTK